MHHYFQFHTALFNNTRDKYQALKHNYAKSPACRDDDKKVKILMLDYNIPLMTKNLIISGLLDSEHLMWGRTYE